MESRLINDINVIRPVEEKKYKTKIEEVNLKLTEIGTIEFDETKHHNLTKELKNIGKKISRN